MLQSKHHSIKHKRGSRVQAAPPHSNPNKKDLYGFTILAGTTLLRYTSIFA